MNNTQRQLLIDWRDALLRLNEMDWKERGFDMDWWAFRREPTDPTLGCGTQCCAYGVGTTLPSWKKAGLTLVQDLFKGGRVSYIHHPKARSILGLTLDDWYRITNPRYYISQPVTPGDVAKRISAMIDKD